MTLPACSDSPSAAAMSRSLVHTRLENAEEALDAGHFMSLMATTEFFIHAVFSIPQITLVAFWYDGRYGPISLSIQYGAALIAVALIWLLFVYRARLVLGGVIIFAAVFSILAFRLVIMSKGIFFTFAFEPTLWAWLAIAWFLGLLGYVDYQFVRAGWNIATTTTAEQAIVRGVATPNVRRFLLRLFSIPAICERLEGPQRRVSVGLFFLATATLCMFVSVLWSLLFTAVPALEYDSRGIRECIPYVLSSPLCRQDVAEWLGVIPFYAAIFGGMMLLAMATRYAARRFTRLSLERLISSDPRPLILFLRSFRDDQVRLQQPRRTLFRRLVSLGEPRPTLDHVLLEEGTPHGPVVALGAPGSKPPFGAARAYVTHQQWRETVADLSYQAGAVVVTMDETEGVRWEIRHVLGENHVRKTLFLLPPRLTSATELTRVLPPAFLDPGQSGDWIEQIRAALTGTKRLCIGWFWRSDGQLELLTTTRNSYLAYVLALRRFLHREADTSNEAAMPTAAQRQPQPVLADGAPAPEPAALMAPRRRKMVGAGIIMTIGVAALTWLTVSFPPVVAIIVAPLASAVVAWWCLSKTRLPPVLVPTVAITLGHCFLFCMGGLIAVVMGNMGEQLFYVLLTLTIFGALLAWVTMRQSRPALICFLVFQLLGFMGGIVTITQGGATQAGLVHLGLYGAEAVASIYALVRLSKPSLRAGKATG